MALSFPGFAHCIQTKKKSPYYQISLDRQQELTELKSISLSARNLTIPSPSIFSTLTNPGPTSSPEVLPTTAHLAIHLALLETLLALKQKIIYSNALDRAFSIKPNDKLVTVGRTRTRAIDATFQMRRAAKWPIFIKLAAARFVSWWESLELIASSGGRRVGLDGSEEMRVDEAWLPPLDVLMVWHTFMLNPAKYKAFCEKHRRLNVYSLDFPWALIHRAFANSHDTFKLEPDAIAVFEEHIGENDLFQCLANHQSHSFAVKAALANMVSSSGKQSLGISFSGLLERPRSATEWSFIDELGSAVERQAHFVDKMSNSLWLRSPALEGTLNRGVVRYERFIQLFKMHPGTMLVPTLDIDLVWHTHQCSPRSYQVFCEREAGRTINHDDSLGKATLKDGFKDTCWLYETRFQEEYNVCLCWECEALKSELEKCDLGSKVDLEAVEKRVQGDVKYYKAFELKRRAEVAEQARK